MTKFHRLEPDFLSDAREPLPSRLDDEDEERDSWAGILADPPYSEADAEEYKPGKLLLPTGTELLRNCLRSVRVGGRVGMIHYICPRPPKDSVKFLACVGVLVGFGNRMRCFSVFERLK